MGDGSSEQTFALYNLEEDPQEIRVLSEGFSEIKEELGNELRMDCGRLN